jgi:streptogramin lyase
VALALTFLASTAWAELGDVLHTIPCAGQNTSDIAWVEGTIYQVIFAPTAERNIYQLDPSNGSVLSIIPYAGGSPQGLTYDGYNLWQGDLSGHLIFKMDPLNGAIRGQFTAPGPSNCQPLGLGWDGNSLWVADSRAPETIWEVDTLGTLLSSFPAPGASPYGLAWAAGYIWVSDNNLGGAAIIYKMDPSNGAVLDSFECPDGGGSPNGIAHDGEHLWIAVNTTDLIYQVDDGIGGAWAPDRAAGPQEVCFSGMTAIPAGSTIEVRFALPAPAPVRVDLFDLLGRQVLPVSVSRHPAGSQRITLGASELGSGAYYLRLEALGTRATAKVVYLRS